MAFPLRKLNNLWAKLPARRRGAVVIAIPAACIAVTLAAWIWSRDSTFLAQQRADHTNQILLQSNNLLIELLNAETGVRGYIIARDDRFLEPYNEALRQVPAELDSLNRLVDDSTAQDQRLQKISELAQRRVGVLEQMIRLSRQNPSSEQIIRSIELNEAVFQGKQVMDETRAAIQEFQTAAQQELAVDSLSQESIQTSTNLLLWSSVAVSVVGTWAAMYLFGKLDQELKDRERLLRESRSMLQAIATHVVDGVIILDDDRRIELFNPTASRLFGYESLEVKGKRLDMLFSDPVMQEYEEDKRSRFAGGQQWKTMGIRKVGSPFPVEISISDLQVENRLIAIIRDISPFEEAQTKLKSRADELVRLTTVLARTNSALEERNKELEQFAYVASHDLKAPLRAIANLSTWIEEDLADNLPPENQHQMRLLRGRVHRMEDLINGLLEYSRIGRSKVPTEMVDIGILLSEVLDSLAPPLTFTIDIQPNLPVFKTRKLLLRQVFLNLIGNAIKHHPNNTGKIRISCQDRGDSYEFAVIDDGSGIHPAYHEKIFVIFQTLEARDTKESTGIGLAIVKKIVETEGGKVWVESTEGEGATFYFTWLKQSISLSVPV
ncbi:CHASE3 domain-containing protein [Phormidium tenue FACHB-886]|nr:CHASE3 domain-containing protein [Phormidium tenue FACHB-886]